jgi:hypothetical protein
VATWVFRPQRHTNGGGIFANFVGTTGNLVTATGAAVAQPAVTTGQIFAYNQINATGNALAQPAVTTGQVKVFIEVFATGDAQADPAVATGQVLVTGFVVVTGDASAQPATTTGQTDTEGFILATGDVTAQLAITTGQINVIEPVQGSGSPQAQPATTTGLVADRGNSIEVTGDAIAQPATTAGSALVVVFVTATGDAQAQNAVTSGQARVPLLGPFDIRMKAPDGEWVEINTHDSQLGITPDNHHPQLHDLTSHTDVNAPAPTLRDGIFWTGSEYANERRTDWQGIWAPGTYEIDDQARDNVFLGIANTQTTDPIAPTPSGIPIYPTDGAIYIDQFQLLGAKVGNQYTMAQDAVITEARIVINVANVGLLTTVDIHINNVQTVATTYVPRVAGLHTFLLPVTFVFINDVVRIEVDTVKQTGNTQVHFEQSVDYWTGYTDPLFSLEQGLLDEVANANAYDIDMLFTPADVSPDWDLQAVSSATLISQSAPAEAAWTRESTNLFNHYFATTVDNVWTEIARIAEPEDVWRTGYAKIVSKRTDLPDRCLIYANFNVWRDGVSPVVASSDAYSQAGGHALMDFRVIGDGNDVVAQVKGFPGETWDWDLTYFFREVT